MSRTVRWLQLHGRQRHYALGLVFAASATGLYSYRRYHPICADSERTTTEEWRNHPAIPKAVNRRDGSDPWTGQNNSNTKVSSAHALPINTESPGVSGGQEKDSEDQTVAWKLATDRVASACSSFVDIDLSSIRETITGLIIPKWVRLLPDWLNKLQNELSMAPWSLSWEIWEEAHDPEINPEIVWDAKVRVSTELCADERVFLHNRRLQTAKALARYLDLAEKEVDPADVPVIGMCGSGGGLRALVAGASSYLSAAEDGLFDCITYTAGVSGSCWLQALYFSSIGAQNHATIIQHLKDRINIHIASPPALFHLLSQSPTNKYLLSGFVEKLRGVPDAEFGLVDIYGLALGARLLVPKQELRISNYDLKISNQRVYTDDGSQPLPIYTAVRHEIPDSTGRVEGMAKDARFTTKHFDWFQWYEWTPYELFCEELNAGIPTWAIGRKWDGGSTVWRENGFALPELRVPLMLGIWGSAFCATLSHYYKEIQPLLKASGLGGLESLISGKSDDLVKVHPIDPAVIPNFALGMRGLLPESCPESIHDTTHLQLMDAGMANNLPLYPLLRPGRDMDVILAFDASADVKGDNWIKVTDGYVRRRGIRGWPMGAGWPPSTSTAESTADQLEEAQDAATETHFDQRLEQTPQELGYCTVWAGTKEERYEYMDEPSHHLISTEQDDLHLASPNAGIALIYLPFLANDKVPGVDPLKDEFMSTWNMVYTPEEIDKVARLAQANYNEGKEQVKRTIRAVYERKKSMRLEQERDAREYAWRCRVRSGNTAMRRNGDVGHGDQFSGM
ncbi:hypothetical protein LTR62_006872 [Meristemomyces frigidus]|uniref:Lysophospholipase n=1 Tax=Meristemomyces frigidus TaxID=1508187 RepID=A0AAN7TN16_9PEZI|nr:hypothetical protein LTR62_006872 [Meristemomyces frigidus]